MDPATAKAIDSAPDYTALFRVVKDLVQRRLGTSRAGIMLGLGRLGLSSSGFLGGYFVLGSNAIVLNRDVLEYVRLKEPAYHNAYAFHVLLHEYLHTLGYLSEGDVRPLAHEITHAALGPDHAATLIAAAMTPGARDARAPAFFRSLVYPEFGWVPPGEPQIQIIKGFDPDATPYIA